VIPDQARKGPRLVAGSAPGAAPQRQRGVVKRWGARAFGFIVPDNGGPDVFLTHKDSYDFLMGGDRVSYEVNLFSDPKRPRAVDVRKI